MASSTSTAAASTLTRHRIAVALASAATAASLGYYYYQYFYRCDHDHTAEAGDSDPATAHAGLHRSNAVRRAQAQREARARARRRAVPLRADLGRGQSQGQGQRHDDSSDSDSHEDSSSDSDDRSEPPEPSPDADATAGVAVPVPVPVPIALPEEPPFDWYNDSSVRDSRQRTGENIVTLLFRVSEDNARRNSHVHRGCLCNGCGMMPIRGIRYRCSNCPDFDLCEMCESHGSHNKAHVFYKIKIPVPSSSSRHVQPPWYPGDPSNIVQALPRHLLAKWTHETGFERVELDALWEQWTFMANTEWREDPYGLGLAMDRKTFERCLVPSAGYRHFAPNLIHDRMFAFYDTNHDDLIGFEEYLHGVTYKKRKDKLKRTFEGYDVDGDGYVNRRDFLRMFRAYYVCYKQMHRDTVEGLDDYMMTNVEVQQLVSGRQPISSMFGRDQRIPDAEGGRHMEGKIFRSGGQVDVPDGKGAVSEDKPDASNREDILRELFTRNGSQSIFTESFGPSRRPQSPARDSQYWSGILNPPRDTVDLGALLSGDNAQLDGILDSIRRRESRIQLAEECETASSDEEYQSSTDDEMDDAAELNHPPVDEELAAVPPPGLPDAREFVVTLPTEVPLQPEIETFASPQQMNMDRRRRIMARKQLYERWKRRQFYLDEEEGALPPQGWRDEQDVLVNVNGSTEASKSGPPLLSPRSRSSSKVRFAEDTDDFETRSNHSTSSRSVPERWGGMEIPDAERDAGKEILYQIAQQAYNELLDTLFKRKEDFAVLAAETKEQREEHRKLLDEFEPREEDEQSIQASPTRPTSPQSPASPTSRPIQQQSLQDLLSTSGYTVASSAVSEGGRTREEIRSQVHNAEAEAPVDPFVSAHPGAASSTDAHSQTVPDHRDPTMPQFMPNSPLSRLFNHVSSSNIVGENSTSVAETSLASTSDKETRSGSDSHITRPDTPSPVPRSQLAKWKTIDQYEQEAKEQGGWGRLNYKEFEEIYRQHEFLAGSKNRLAYLGSWIDFCIPS